MKLDRRELLKNAAFVSGAALVGTSWPPSKKSFAEAVLSDLPNLPSPANSGIEHIVVLTMENRSFDHFLGWLPNADGKQAGLTFADSAGVSHATHSLSGDYTGCPHPDPDHSYGGARVEYDGGRMDGFLRADSNDVYSIGYYGEQDIPFYAALARPIPLVTVTSPRSLGRPFRIVCFCMLLKPTASTIAPARPFAHPYYWAAFTVMGHSRRKASI